MDRRTTRMRALLTAVYGETVTVEVWPQLVARLEGFREAHPGLCVENVPPEERQTERDVILITYGDQITEPGKPPLRTLDETLRTWVGDILTGIHILPFFPYSSDDGFSIIDYKQVNPAWGSWSDVEQMGQHFRLMFDAVINHISQESAWFRAYRDGSAPYDDYFIAVEPGTDLSTVVRPRTLPLLTPVETVDGTKHVWTTFSADQIDLNYASPDLLLDVIDVLLFYVEHGAQLIRLDAIGFMWKEIGTSCIHLPQVHHLIQLMRAALDEVAPGTLLVTETNVPHAENISYFGDGFNEAQMVYNFTLPPLTLHAFMTGDATHLSRWAATLETPSDRTTFFNFLASHDGIGLRPLEGILPAEAIDALAEQVKAHRGLVAYKSNSDGSQSPYELNIVYYDALNNPDADESQARQVDRFLASQAILLSLAGVPGIYVHSLFGSRNWRDGVMHTGQNRTINRRKFRRSTLEAKLLDPETVPHQVFRRYKELIQTRTAEPAFHPNGAQAVLETNPALFTLMRTALDGSRGVLCVHNVSDAAQRLVVSLTDLVLPSDQELTDQELTDQELTDIISGERFATANGTLKLLIQPYQVRWLVHLGANPPRLTPEVG